LREAFAGTHTLPDEILYGKKEAFSDAVGLSWKEELSKWCKMNLPSKIIVNPDMIPDTAEAIYYQSKFHEFFGPQWHLLKKLWLPNQVWVATGSEPSARVLSVY
jgi:asparagine synthetase B (glutamine-hydrolysing)